MFIIIKDGKENSEHKVNKEEFFAWMRPQKPWSRDTETMTILDF